MPPVAQSDSIWDMPLHPALVHFPIAFLFTSSVLVLVRHGAGRVALERYIAPLLVAGTLALPVVMLAGLRDAGWLDLVREADLSQPMVWHALAATTAAACAAAHLVVRVRTRGGISRTADLSFAVSTAWLLLLTGQLAGEMVYR